METMTSTIINARVKATAFHSLLSGALSHAHKRDDLPALCGVYLGREAGAINARATDRYRLIVGEIESEGEGEGEGVRLAYDDVKRLISSLSKVKRGEVEITIAGDLVSVKVEGSTLTFTGYATTFPPYRHLFPQEGETFPDMPSVSFNPSFFADYGKIVGKKGQVIIRQQGQNKPYQVTIFPEDSAVKWQALLMPMRVR